MFGGGSYGSTSYGAGGAETFDVDAMLSSDDPLIYTVELSARRVNDAAHRADDFARATIGGGLPAGWTSPWTAGTYDVIADPIGGSASGRELQLSGASSAYRCLHLDAIGTAADVDLVASVRMAGLPAGTAIVGGVAGRVSGAAGTHTGYLFALVTSSGAPIAVAMYSAVAGSVTFKAAAGFTWAAGTRYLLRLRCVGTAIKGRVWAAGSAEPLAWTIEITDSAVTGAGHAGFFAFANEADPICDYFAAATDGDAAALPGQETLRLGSAEWATPSTDVPASAPFDGRLTTVLEFGRSIVDSSRVGIGFQADEGQIAFANDDGAYDRYVDLYAVDGRPVTVRVGRKADPFSDHLVIFRGVALDWTAGDDVVTVRIRDRGFLLDVPAQPNLYAGTGGAEGGAELEGKRKPLCLGQVAAMEPTRVYSSIRLYQFSDGPIEGVIGVLDRGTVLTYQATVTDYAALVATAVTAGNYKQSQDGYFKLGSTPAGALFAGSAMLGDWPVYNTVDLIRQLFAHAADLAADDLDESSFDAVDVASAAEVNFHLAQDDASTVGEAVADLMAGIGGWAGFNRRGQLELGIFAAPAGDAVAAFDRTDIIELRRESLPEGVWPPPYRWRVAYHRNWETFNDWAASVPASIADLYTQPYLLSSASDDYLLANHPEAKDPPPVEAFFFLAADAETEAARLLALFSSGYRLYRLTLSRRGLLLGLGNVIDVTYPRWGFDAGKLGVVVAIDDRIELRDGSDVDQVEIVIFA